MQSTETTNSRRKPRFWQAALLVLLVATALGWVLSRRPTPNPVARIQVIDAAGLPVAGAIVRPYAMRTKAGFYQGAHYGWNPDHAAVKPVPVPTDSAGVAVLEYPKFVVERLETGELSLMVSHADYVTENAHRTVATWPPARAPWRDWWLALKHRALARQLVAHPEPVVLQRGAVVALTIRRSDDRPIVGRLRAQADGHMEATFWTNAAPDVLLTRRMPGGSQFLRALSLESPDEVWFSDVINATIQPGGTNELALVLRRGVTLRGLLDAQVPRPVDDGRVIVHVWPEGIPPSLNPPQWHTWARVESDGSFAVPALPAGSLEVLAICRGFISTNPPGSFGLLKPQKHILGTNDLDITVGMEPTARLEVRVLDDHAKPIAGAVVAAWPNVQYGDYAATIIASDLIRMDEVLGMDLEERRSNNWGQPVGDFTGTSGPDGVAVVPNLPGFVTHLAVTHSNYALPAVKGGSGGLERTAAVTLRPGGRNELELRLEPAGRAPIAHH